MLLFDNIARTVNISIKSDLHNTSIHTNIEMLSSHCEGWYSHCMTKEITD